MTTITMDRGALARVLSTGNAVLTESDVIAIRRRIARGERNPSIAADYSVSISTIHLIRHDRIWRHVA